MGTEPSQIGSSRPRPVACGTLLLLRRVDLASYPVVAPRWCARR
jgi:hypothetical protein